MEACILIGGRSTRMGQEKPLIQVEGTTVLESTIQKVSGLVDHIYLVANRDNLPLYVKYASDTISVIQDQVEDVGPLGGIHTGLSKIKGDEAFILAGDLPFLDVELLKELRLAYFDDPEVDAVVCRVKAGIEPLVAIYSKKTLPLAAKLIEECKLSIRSLLESVNTKYYACWSEEETFYNLNEPEDLNPSFLLRGK